jgi:hypothetical protein
MILGRSVPNMARIYEVHRESTVKTGEMAVPELTQWDDDL